MEKAKPEEQKLIDYRKRFRRAGSVGLPFIQGEDIPKIKNLIAQSNGEHRPLLTLIVTSSRKLDILAEIMTRIQGPVRIRHIESRKPQLGGDNFELFLQMELGNGQKPDTIVDSMRMVGLDVVQIDCDIPVEAQTGGDEGLFFDEGAEEAISGSPWFPRTANDLDISSRRVLMYGAELDADHPGFKDPVYRKRRMMFADLAMKYKHGENIDRVEYTSEETETWGKVYRELRTLHQKYACKPYLENFKLLEKYCGYNEHNIPQLQDVSEFLKAKTGFRVRPVAGYLSSRDFLAGLAFRVFHCTQYIRHPSDPFYSPEPDCVHELMGHMPLFADPDFAQFSQDIGLASLGVSEEAVNKLATLYFFSIEFGLSVEREGFKVYGAGLLSSAAELKHAIEDDCARLCFDPERVVKQECMITCFQQAYFYTNDFDEAQQKLRTFVNNMRRPFLVRYNPYTESVEVLNNRRSITAAINSLQADMNVLAAALHQVL